MSDLDLTAINARHGHATKLTAQAITQGRAPDADMAVAFAAARSAADVPTLLAEVAQLRAELARATYDQVQMADDLARVRLQLADRPRVFGPGATEPDAIGQVRDLNTGEVMARCKSGCWHLADGYLNHDGEDGLDYFDWTDVLANGEVIEILAPGGGESRG